MRKNHARDITNYHKKKTDAHKFRIKIRDIITYRLIRHACGYRFVCFFMSLLNNRKCLLVFVFFLYFLYVATAILYLLHKDFFVDHSFISI